MFVKAYDQLDFNLSYDLNDHIALLVRGHQPDQVEHHQTFARTENQPWFIVEGDRRFYLGARYKF